MTVHAFQRWEVRQGALLEGYLGTSWAVADEACVVRGADFHQGPRAPSSESNSDQQLIKHECIF
jgi:hypothetical protein